MKKIKSVVFTVQFSVVLENETIPDKVFEQLKQVEELGSTLDMGTVDEKLYSETMDWLYHKVDITGTYPSYEIDELEVEETNG